eukprot:500915_1
MSTPVYKNKDPFNECKQVDVLQCESFHRIKLLLSKCNITTTTKIKDVLHQLNNGTYSTTALLNDFHHLKYSHSVDKDVKQFEKTSMAIIDQSCDINVCKHLARHYRDRTQQHTNNDNNNNYCLNLISRIHTYFAHSYDLNKLTPDDITFLNNELNQFKQTLNTKDDTSTYLDEIHEHKLGVLYTIMSNKKGKLIKTLNYENDKYIEPAETDEIKTDQSQYQLFVDSLQADNGLDLFSSLIIKEEYDTEAIYYDIIQEYDTS